MAGAIRGRLGPERGSICSQRGLDVGCLHMSGAAPSLLLKPSLCGVARQRRFTGDSVIGQQVSHRRSFLHKSASRTAFGRVQSWEGYKNMGACYIRRVSIPAVAEAGIPVEEQSLRDGVSSGTGSIKRSTQTVGVIQGSPVALSTPALGGSIPATGVSHTLSPEVAEQTIKPPPRKRSGSLLDSIRTKVLNTPEEEAAKAASIARLRRKRVLGRPMIKRPRTGVTSRLAALESIESAFGVRSDTVQKDGTSLNGTAIRLGRSEDGSHAGSLNGALWAVATTASKIANGGLQVGAGKGGETASSGNSASPSQGSFLEGAMREGKKEAQGVVRKASAAMRTEVSQFRNETAIKLEGEKGSDRLPGAAASLQKQSSKKNGAKGGGGEQGLGNPTLFEDRVMEALRKKGPIIAETRPVSKLESLEGDRAYLAEAGPTEAIEEEERMDSGLMASTSGRDVNPVLNPVRKPRKGRASKVSPATESLIEQALSEEELGKVSINAAPKRTRKRVQKVVSVGVEGEKPKRVRKRVRVRTSEVVGGLALEGGAGDNSRNRAVDAGTEASLDGLKAGFEGLRAGSEGSDAGLEGLKPDQRGFNARTGRLLALGAASFPPAAEVATSRPSEDFDNVRLRGRAATAVDRSEWTVGDDLAGMVDGVVTRTGVPSLGDLGQRTPRLATQTVKQSPTLVVQGPSNGRQNRGAESDARPLKVATSQVALGPIQALRASAPGVVSGDLDGDKAGPKVATNRVENGLETGDLGKGLQQSEVADEGFRNEQVTRDRAPVARRVEKEGGKPKMATMKVPLGPIAALRASASQPLRQLAEEDVTGGSFGEVATGAPGRHGSSAVPKGSGTLDYLSDVVLEEADVAEEDHVGVVGDEFAIEARAGSRSSTRRGGLAAAALDYLSDPEEGDEEERSAAFGPVGTAKKEMNEPASGVAGGQIASSRGTPETVSYYSKSLLGDHRKTEKPVAWGRDVTHNEIDLAQFDYNVDPLKSIEAESEPVEKLPSRLQRRRRRGRQSEADSKEGVSGAEIDGQKPATQQSNGQFMLMHATWRDLSEGRLDPAGYEVVSAKSGALIGQVTALEPLKAAEEKEMEETGLRLHTGILRVTAVDGFIDEFEGERRESSALNKRSVVEQGTEERLYALGRGAGLAVGSRRSPGGAVGSNQSLGGSSTAVDALSDERERDSGGWGVSESDWENLLMGDAGEGESEGDDVADDSEDDVVADADVSVDDDVADDGDVLASLDDMLAALGSSDSGSDPDDDFPQRTEFAIPVIGEYIADVSVRERRIRVALPGLLDRVSRRPAILRGLGMALYRYCSGKKHNVKMLAEVKDKTSRGRVGDGRERGRKVARQNSTVHPQITYMPTEKELFTDGREDILEDIQLVGGFAAATNALGLSRQKRAIGFWENKLHLDAEIELFNYSRWTKRTHPDTGAVYWVNLLNDMVARDRPPPPSSSTPPLPVSYREEDADTACMPKRKDVQEAGRWDLHHAIVSHGGYTAVSRELGRQTPPLQPSGLREQASKYAFPEMLVSAIRKVMKEKNLTKLPSIRDFKEMGRADIVFGFRRHGGLLAVAELMKVEPKRTGQWTLASAAAALNEYIEEKAARTGEGRAMPTLKELQLAGKSNLRYVIQHFGQKVMAEQVGLPPNLSTHEKKRLRAAQLNAKRRRGQAIRRSQEEEHLIRVGG